MSCEIKESLQKACVVACDELESATEILKANTGFSCDYRSHDFGWQPPASAAKDWPAAFSTVSAARAKHLKAGSELSKHLSDHRC